MSTQESTVGTTAEQARIPFLVKLGYGGFEGSYALIWTTFYAFFLFFATDVVGLSPASAGLILLISALADAISDPLTGVLTDKVSTRWGRRRPILVAVAAPFGFVSWLLFTTPGWSEGATIAYYVILVIVFYTIIDLVWTPGLALGAEMTLDYDERTSLAGFRTAWDLGAAFLALSTCLLLADLFTGLLGSATAGWSAMAALFGLIAVFPILLTWRSTRGYERHREEEPKLTPRAIWGALTKNRSFYPILGLYVLAGAGANFVIATAVYWSTYWFGYGEEETSLLFATFALAQIIWVPILAWVGRKIGKRLTVAYSYGLAVIVLVGLWFIKPMGGAELGIAALLLSLGSVINPALWIIAGAMIADSVEVDEFKTGQRREGVYYSAASFVQKVAIALVLWSTGVILERSGYIAGVEQSASSLTAIRALVSWAPALLIALAIIFALVNPMTREKHAALLEALRLKKAGQPYDIEPIRDLVE